MTNFIPDEIIIVTPSDPPPLKENKITEKNISPKYFPISSKFIPRKGKLSPNFFPPNFLALNVNEPWRCLLSRDEG